MGFSSSKLKKLRSNLSLGLGSMLVLLLVLGFFSVSSQSENNENTSALERSSQVLLEIERITAIINEAESAQRGYIATRLPSFLGPFHGAYRRVLVKVYRVEALLRDDGVQQKRLGQLKELTKKRFILLHRGLSGETAYNDALMEEREVKASIGTAINALRDTESLKQKALIARAAQSKQKTIFLTLLFSLLGIGSACVFFFRIAREMTRRTLAEVQLKLKNHRLEQYTKELEQIAYISAHDLKEPLRSIASYSELIVRHTEDTKKEKIKEYSEILIGKVKRLSDVIDALKDFSSISNNDGNFVTVNTQAALESVRNRYADIIRETNTVITCEKLPSVKGIPLQVEQLFLNLIDNSIKFRKNTAAPVIEIKVKETDQMWQFSVKDNGIGIDNKYSHKLFRVFNTLHPSDKYKGTGIGLATCKKIVETHEGSIWLEPDASEGAMISFTLPKA